MKNYIQLLKKRNKKVGQKEKLKLKHDEKNNEEDKSKVDLDVINKELNNVKIKDNIMEIGNKKIVFNNNIYQIIEANDRVFVVIKLLLNQSNYTYDDEHNVYCYLYTGEKLWQIKNVPGMSPSAYVGIWYEDNILHVTNFDGVRFKVNVENGDLSDMEFVK